MQNTAVFQQANIWLWQTELPWFSQLSNKVARFSNFDFFYLTLTVWLSNEHLFCLFLHFRFLACSTFFVCLLSLPYWCSSLKILVCLCQRVEKNDCVMFGCFDAAYLQRRLGFVKVKRKMHFLAKVRGHKLQSFIWWTF